MPMRPETNRAEAPIGPIVRRREDEEPDWLCDRGYIDEFGRTWLCERVKHEPRQRHQSSVYVAADGSPGTVGWQHRLEWAEP
jgi:hypothetical protein